MLALGAITPQTVRAQSFALPLLAVCLCLLAADARAPARRTWWLVPVTLLWANLHGSVLLAPVLAGLLASSRLLMSLRERRPVNFALLRRDGALCAALALAVVVTPYGVAGLGYYRSTLGNPNFRAHIVEWRPLSFSSEPTTVALIVAVAAVIAAGYRKAPVFPLLVCAALSALTLHSARHATPLAWPLPRCCLLQPTSRSADGCASSRTRDSREPRAGSCRHGSPVPGRRARARTAHPAHRAAPRVYGPSGGSGCALPTHPRRRDHSDRLLWYHPELHGRLSHDVRIEVVPAAFLAAITRVHAEPSSERSRRWLRGYDLVIVDRKEHPELWSALRDNPDFTLAAEDALGAAFVRSAPGS